MYVRAGQPLRAVRCMFWMFLNLVLRGEVSAATGWLGRAERLLEREEADCVERGYLLLPLAIEGLLETGDYETAEAAAVAATSSGEGRLATLRLKRSERCAVASPTRSSAACSSMSGHGPTPPSPRRRQLINSNMVRT